MNVGVCFTPQDYLLRNFSGGHTAVVMDVLRATTCIVAALNNGCRQFVPVATVDEALAMKNEFPDALLGGERQAVRIPGFDLGNSPFEYSRAVVEDKTVIMSTTNGTVALKTAAEASLVYVGAFVNASALCRRLAEAKKDTVLLCAGTQGRFSLEDALCAGLVADRLGDLGVKLDDAAIAARAMYRDFSRGDIVTQVTESSHAANLLKLGFAADIAYCLRPDTYGIVPEYREGIVAI